VRARSVQSNSDTARVVRRPRPPIRTCGPVASEWTAEQLREWTPPHAAGSTGDWALSVARTSHTKAAFLRQRNKDRVNGMLRPDARREPFLHRATKVLAKGETAVNALLTSRLMIPSATDPLAPSRRSEAALDRARARKQRLDRLVEPCPRARRADDGEVSTGRCQGCMVRLLDRFRVGPGW
jgi:hypothetical protein